MSLALQVREDLQRPVERPPSVDLERIERECDFEDLDMDEIPANNPKVSQIHENEMSKINNEEFFSRMKRQLEERVNNYQGNAGDLAEIKETLGRCHDLCKELQIRDRVIVTQPPVKNLISRHT